MIFLCRYLVNKIGILDGGKVAVAWESLILVKRRATQLNEEKLFNIKSADYELRALKRREGFTCRSQLANNKKVFIHSFRMQAHVKLIFN